MGLKELLADPDSIQDSAAYQFRFDQGLQGADRSAAARGGLYSGGHSADLLKFGQGLASQEYADQWNRLANIATMGQNAAVQAGSSMQNTANNIGNLYAQQGQNNANATIGRANAYGNALAGLSSIAGQYLGARSQPQPAQTTNWGAFTPTVSTQQPATPQYTGFNPQTGSAFGQWGGWT